MVDVSTSCYLQLASGCDRSHARGAEQAAAVGLFPAVRRRRLHRVCGVAQVDSDWLLSLTGGRRSSSRPTVALPVIGDPIAQLGTVPCRHSTEQGVL